jgi:hypothetical protein
VFEISMNMNSQIPRRRGEVYEYLPSFRVCGIIWTISPCLFSQEGMKVEGNAKYWNATEAEVSCEKLFFQRSTTRERRHVCCACMFTALRASTEAQAVEIFIRCERKRQEWKNWLSVGFFNMKIVDIRVLKYIKQRYLTHTDTNISNTVIYFLLNHTEFSIY